MLRSAEVAALLRVHPKHVYRLLKRGLPARRVGGEWRFDRGEVLAWAGARGAPEPSGTGAAPTVAGLGEPAPPSLVAANGDLAVLALLRIAGDRGPLVGLVHADMTRAAALLREGAVLLAGAHAGGFPAHLDGERIARIHLVTREVGLLGPAGKPPRLRDVPRFRLASRPPAAGVRAHLDAALVREGLDPERVHRGALLLDSHLEVACAVAAGRADAGLGSRAWAAEAGLSFTPLAVEAYGLIVKARHLGDPRVVRLCEVAQGEPFQARARAHAGYDPGGAGDIRYDA
jgi:excisionase family DNA binding protein